MPAGSSCTGRPAARGAFPVVVIGCGQSGLLAGIRLKEAGIPFTIIEKNPGVGGTWWENRYPGARVDVGNHFYCYSFEPSDHWTEFFAQQPELQAYFEGVMDTHGIDAARPVGAPKCSARHGTTPTATWTVRVRDARTAPRNTLDGAGGHLCGRSAQPPAHCPTSPAPETFAGPSFHSARWDH